MKFESISASLIDREGGSLKLDMQGDTLFLELEEGVDIVALDARQVRMLHKICEDFLSSQQSDEAGRNRPI